MNMQLAITILDAHSISHRMVDGILQVLDCYTDHQAWITCPKTRHELAVWLGY